MKNRFLPILLLATLTIVGCTEQKVETNNTIYVSIAPLKPIIEGVVGDDFAVEVIVPQGSSPETFEPSPRQMRELEGAKFVFSVGLLNFERTLVERITRDGQLVELHKGVELLGGCCSHANHANHAHGIDPHIWCSPKSLGTMADNAYQAITTAMPDSLKYGDNYNSLCLRLLELDEEVAEMCHASGKSSFIIYHPALTYLARDYNLTQIAIEHEGKEPSARRIGEIIDLARQNDIKHILYQAEFPASSVEVICQDAGADAVEINPLSEDIFTNIRTITTLITE